MKTIITSIVALATTLSTMSTPVNSIGELPGNEKLSKDSPAAITKVAGPSASFASEKESLHSKMTRLTNKSDDLKGRYAYDKVMADMLTKIEMERHLDALEDLKAENAYSNLMNKMLIGIENEKFEDQLQDLAAYDHFQQLMQTILAQTATRQN
ncbi:MAG TPA: hypothetical protein VK907_06675 [Phnomibacter sp.]|nr:hypothetical protein [Phnomibacter sp.]